MKDLKRFRSFVVAAEEQHVGRAARRLRLAQPALTRQLHALEREVGAKLIERHPRGIRLTAAGLAFLEHARRALAAAEAAEVAARQAAACTRVSLLRVSPPDWPNRARQVHRAIDAFRQAMHGVDVEYDLTPWVLHSQALLSGTTDVGFGIAMSHEDYGPHIAAHRLLDEPASSAVLPSSHPLADRATLMLSDLRDIPLLVPPRDCAPILHDQMVATVRSGGYEPKVIAAPTSFALAAQIIVAGAGWTITTHSVGEEPPHGAVVIPIRDASVMLGFYVLHRASDHRATIREFVRHVRLAIDPGLTQGSLREVFASEHDSPSAESQ